MTNLVRGVSSKDEEVNRMGAYFLFADSFGYTPSEVDELDLFTMQSLSLLIQAKAKEESEAIKRARKR